MIGVLLDTFSVLLILCIIPTVWLIYKKKLTFLNGMFLGTFLFLMSFGCSVYGTELLYGYSPIDSMINNVFDEIQAVYSSVQGISDSDISAINQLIEVLKKTYFTMMPTIVVTGCLMWSYLVIMLSKGVLALFKKDVSGFWKFCDFKMPKTAIILAALAYVLSIIFEDEQIGYAFLNFSSIIFSLVSVCGFSVIDYGLRKKVKISVLRAIIYVFSIGLLTLLMGMGTTLLTFVGMTDAFFDIRNISIKIKKS